MAANRVEAVRQALPHIPAAESSPAEVHRLRAWLAAARGDLAAEHRELDQLIRIDGLKPTILDRLIQLAENAGEPARAAELRHQKADCDRLLARYKKLHARQQPIRDAVELARLAEQLGRRFEARAFLVLAVSDEPDRQDLRRDLLRLAPGPPDDHPPGATLAQVVAD